LFDFIAREKKPTYVFGPVKDFDRTIGGTTAWIIEDLGLERPEGAAKLPSVDCIWFTYIYRLMHEPRMNRAVDACYRAKI